MNPKLLCSWPEEEGLPVSGPEEEIACDRTLHPCCALTDDEVGTVMADMKGVMVAVTGNCNRGKISLLDAITRDAESGLTLPAGFSISTPGISAKHTKVKKQDLVLVDTAATNAPISFSSFRTDLEIAVTEEQFLRACVAKLCNDYVFVVSKLTRKEHADLLALCDLCKQGTQSGRKQVFVVHNLLHVETEEEFNRYFEEVVSILNASDASRVPRHAGMIFTYSFDEIHHKGKVLKTDGAFVHIEWLDGHILPKTSFQIDEWQQLVREQKIMPDAFVVEHATLESDAGRGVVRCIRGFVEGVEQLHVFLAKEGSIAGNKWNKITIDHLRNSIVTGASRTTGMHIDQGGRVEKHHGWYG